MINRLTTRNQVYSENKTMAEKHYNIDYLSETMKLLQGVKHKSYTYFESTPDGGTIVDLGCGTGQDLCHMARAFQGNNLHFIGIDHDPKMISKAKELIETDNNVEFFVGDALHLPLDDEAVGGIRMERLVQHIAKPVALFKEVYRVVKIGGRAVIVESDWKSISFYNGNLSVSDKLNNYLSTKKVNNGKAAQSLTTYLRNIGFRKITLEVTPFVLSSYNDACTYLWIDKMIAEMLTLDLITQAEHDDFVAAQKYADEQGFFSCSMNIVVVSGVK